MINLDLLLVFVALWLLAFYSGYVTAGGLAPHTGPHERGGGALGA